MYVKNIDQNAGIVAKATQSAIDILRSQGVTVSADLADTLYVQIFEAPNASDQARNERNEELATKARLELRLEIKGAIYKMGGHPLTLKCPNEKRRAIRDRHDCQKNLNPYPWFDFDEPEQTYLEIAVQLFTRWVKPYWVGTLAAHRSWEPGEKKILVDMFREFTGGFTPEEVMQKLPPSVRMRV